LCYNVDMAKKITYPIPVSIRFTDDAQKDISRIIAAHSVPGHEINRSEAIHIALAAYAATCAPLVERVAPDAILAD